MMDKNGTMYNEELVKPREIVIAQYLMLITSPIFLLLGSINNIAGVIIMYRLSYRLWSVCMYLYIISLLDLFILYVECGNQWLYAMTDHRENVSHMIMVITEATCKVYTFAFNFAVHFHTWLMVTAIIECCIAMKKTHKTIIRRKREHTRAIIIFNGVILFLVNCHFFWTYGLIKPSEIAQIPYTICSYTREWSDKFQDYVWPWLNGSVGHYMPFVMSLVVMTVIIFTQCRRGKQLGEEYEKDKKYFMDVDAFEEIKKILRILGYIFTIIMLMKSFHSIFPFLVEKAHILPNTYQLQISYALIESMFKTVFFAFRSTKFFLYVGLSSRVRKEVRDIMSKVAKKLCGKGKTRANDSEQNIELLDKNRPMKKGKELTNDTISTLV